jgi:hypothetical protein
LVLVRTFGSRIDADLACGALASANIESLVVADDAGGNQPGLWLSGVRLLVRAEDVDRARDVLGPAEP